jgi:hypothetical protein
VCTLIPAVYFHHDLITWMQKLETIFSNTKLMRLEGLDFSNSRTGVLPMKKLQILS